MRWFWIDKFVEFQSGRRAVAIKNVSLAEEQLDEYLPGFPMMPSSLMVEGLAQTGGLLVAEHGQFLTRVVLAKIGRAVFYRPAVPGDTLRYTAVAEDIKPTGAICKGTCHVGEELIAEVDLVFAQLDDRFQGVELFSPADMSRMLRYFRLYEIGVQPDGTPLRMPEHLLQAEAADV